MAVQTTTLLDAIIARVYNRERLAKLVPVNDVLGQWTGVDSGESEQAPKGLFPVVPSAGGTAYRWTVQTAGPTARQLSEGQAPPAPTGNTYVEASLSYLTGYFDVALEITGQTIDALQNEGAIIAELDKQIVDAAGSIVTTANQYGLGTANWGLQLAIDSAGTYAGLARGTYTSWVAGEQAVGGALNRAVMRDAVEHVTAQTRGALRSNLVWMFPAGVISDYHALGVSTATPNQMVVVGGQPLDIGFTGQFFEGIPIVEVPDLTSTVALLVDRTKIYWVDHHPLSIEKKATPGFTEAWYLVASRILVVENCVPHYKLTGIV